VTQPTIPKKYNDARDVMSLEANMDLAILEAQMNAEELFEKWRKEFLGFRADPLAAPVQPVTGGVINAE